MTTDNKKDPAQQINPGHLGHRERLRQRFTANPATLPDYELLELLLGYVVLRKDTKPLAKDLLKQFENLKGVLDAPCAELRPLKDFGPAMQTFWEVLKELRARYAEIAPRDKIVLNKPEKVVSMARQRLAGIAHEEAWAIFLDNQNRLIAWQNITSGSGGHVYIPSMDVLRMAVEYNATGIILAHNHPGGNAMPSPSDIDITIKIANAAKHLGIRVLDHIIVTEDGHFSMSENNLLT